MEQELNKYLIADVTNIVTSYIEPYRLAIQDNSASMFNRVSNRIELINLTDGITEALIKTNLSIYGSIVFKSQLYYLTYNCLNGRYTLYCYDIETKNTTAVYEIDDTFPQQMSLFRKDNNIVINLSKTKVCYNVITGIITNSDLYPVNDIRAISDDSYIHQHYQAKIKIFQTREVLKITIDDVEYSVNGCFGYNKFYHVRVHQDLVYVIEFDCSHVYIYDYKLNQLVKTVKFETFISYYCFSDQTVETSRYYIC